MLLLGSHMSRQEILKILASKEADGKFLWIHKWIFHDLWKVSITENSEIREEKETLKILFLFWLSCFPFLSLQK